jgi:hypothetical protein
LLGVEHVFQMGGAQAIAAFAYGTRTVPRADRIVGPGNIYVAAAKKLLAGEVGIDFVAGPTEILIISADGDPRHLAADMLAQAEHDVDASAILLTTSKRLAARWPRKSSGSLRSADRRRRAQAIARNSAPSCWCGRSMRPSKFPTASRPSTSAFRTRSLLRASARRQRLHRPVQPGSGGRLRIRTQSRAAHQRRGALARRPVGGRFSESDFGAATEPRRCRAGARHHHAGPRRGPGSARALRGGADK